MSLRNGLSSGRLNVASHHIGVIALREKAAAQNWNAQRMVESRKGSFCRVVIENLIFARIADSPSPFKTAESVSEEQ